MSDLWMYQNLSHISLSTNNKIFIRQYIHKYLQYLPHNQIIWTESSTTKIRMANQDDFRRILMIFWIHQIVLTADIEKIYSQINVNENCQLHQQIFCRENLNDSLEIYRLKTVVGYCQCCQMKFIVILTHYL